MPRCAWTAPSAARYNGSVARAWLAVAAVLAAATAWADAPPSADEPPPFVLPGGNLITATMPHGLGRDEARVRVTQMLAYWTRRFGVKSEWRDFRVYLTGSVWGVDFKAVFEVREADVSGSATDPGLLLRGPARSYASRKLKKYLHPTYQEP